MQLKDYVMAQALWDPTVSSDQLISDFVTGYYGSKAAPFLQTYMDAMVAGIDNSSYYMHESFDITAPFLTPTLLLEAAWSFANASKVADDVRFLQRVEQAAMPVMYVVLFRWDEVQSFATKAAIAWPYNTTKRPEFDEFKRRYQAIGMNKLDEGGHDIDWMEKALFPSASDAWNSKAPTPSRDAPVRVSSTHWPVQ